MKAYIYKPILKNPSRIVRTFLFVLITFLITACQSFEEIDPPASQLTGIEVFKDSKSAQAAINDIFAQLRDTGILNGNVNGISNLMGHYADELDLYGNSREDVRSFYNNTLLPSQQSVEIIWTSAYNLVYASNLILEQTQKSSSISQEDKDRLLGEALFLRGLLHFYLVNLYGEIPYVTTTDYGVNTTIAKISIDEIYAHIIEDLRDSESLLPSQYLSTDRIYPIKYTAAALLSRVYLYNQEWTAAESEATKVINTESLYALESVDQVFLKDSKSTIWQFDSGFEGGNTLEAKTFIFNSVPPPNSALTASLVSAFEPGDLRFQNWIGKVDDSLKTWYYPYKYKINTTTSSSQEYSVILRLAEQYLIRAESRAQMGNIQGALSDINKVRTRAGLVSFEDLNISELLEAILHERQVELFTEYGHRFFDLKRSQVATEILTPLKPGWNPTDVLLPIPESQLLADPNLLPQNPGY